MPQAGKSLLGSIWIGILLWALAGSGLLVYDGGSDNFARHLIRGTFNDTPEFYFPSFGFYVGSSNVLQWCYHHWPSLEWFDGYSVLMLWLLASGLMLSRKHQPNESASPNPYARLVLLGLLLLPAVLLYELTKTSILLSFAGAWLWNENRSAKNPSAITGLLMLLAAFMLRVEGGFLGSGLYLLFRFIKIIQTGYASAFFKKTVPLLLLMYAGMYVLVNIPFTSMDREYVQIRPYQFTLWDFGFDRTKLQLTHPNAEMILEAGTKHFLADPEYLNASTFAKIGLPAKDKTLTAWSAYLMHFDANLMKMKSEWKKAWPYTWPAILSCLGILLMTGIAAPKKWTFFLSTLLLLLLFSITMKLERHLVQPLLAACGIWLLQSFPVKPKPGFWITALLLQLPLLMYAVHVNQDRRSEADRMQEFLLPLTQSAADQAVYFDLYTQVKTHIRMFDPPEPGPGHWKSFDNGILFLYPSWKKSIQQDPNAPFSLKKLALSWKQKPSPLFVFAPERAEWMSAYLYRVHRVPIRFETTDSKTNWMRIYQLQITPR